VIWKVLARVVVIFISENTCAGSRPDQVPDQIPDLASEIEEVVAPCWAGSVASKEMCKVGVV
jgi:hypothetical protein